MTAQSPDQVIIDGREFALTAIDGEGLFDPRSQGIEPIPAGTAHVRGYTCTYLIDNDDFILRDLYVGSLAPPGPLMGISPVKVYPRIDTIWRFTGLRIAVSFSGSLLVGCDESPSVTPVRIGFWPAWYFEEVLELEFLEGRLVDRSDRSREIAEVRRRLTAGPPPHEEMLTVYRTAKSLTYDYSWPGHN